MSELIDPIQRLRSFEWIQEIYLVMAELHEFMRNKKSQEIARL